MNWGFQNGTKVHKVKARKNLTVMLISDPTKNGVTLRVPKWVRFPLMILPVLLIMAGLYTYSHITDLESQLAAAKAEAMSNELTIMGKESTIDELMETDDKRYNQLEGLAKLTVELKNRLSDLESYKNVIDAKLNSTDKTTDTQPTRSSSASRESKESTSTTERTFTTAGTTEEFFPLEVEADIQEDADVFGAEVDRILEELTGAIDEIDTEKSSLAEREEEIEEILPYWEAYPSVLPVDDTYITSPYGYRRNPFGSGYEFHSGVDFKAYYQDVWATGSGVVTYSGYNSGYGYMVIIDHGYGIVSKYAHNSKLYVEEGDQVERYDVIARSGNSGRSSGPHLHYEILENGENQDPLDYIYEGDQD